MKNARIDGLRLELIRVRGRIRLALAMVLTCQTAWAERDPAECISTHADAQVLAKSGQLQAAGKMFESCSTADCPKVIQKDCKNLGKAVVKSIPTLRLSAMDHDGSVLEDFRVELDGVALLPDASTQSIAVDPGEHRFRLLAPGHPAAEVTVPARAGQKDRSIVIQFAPIDPVARKARMAGHVLAGIGAIGVVSFAAFGISGYVDQHQLERATARIDNHEDLATADRMRQKYLFADVSLGVGLVSLGVATYLLLITKDSVEHAPPRSPVAFDLRGFKEGAAAFVRSEF